MVCEEDHAGHHSHHSHVAACAHKQVIEETHAFYNKLKSGKRANSEELSLI